MPLVSISYAQRKPMPPVNWLATVYHGLPQNLYRPYPVARGHYLAFLGRICPEKGIEDAIAIARRTGIPLKIGAKVDKADREYFEARIEPELRDPLLEFVGEVNDAEKNELLGNALAMLFPIAWPEPFGLVMIEAAACGTPVIAFPCGSVPEIVEDGVTGFLVQNVEEAAHAVGRAQTLDRAQIRRRFEQRFTVGRMTGKYLDVYNRVLDSRPAIAAA